MKILYVHERFGSLAGAEANVLITASELKARGHGTGILHGSRTGRGEPAWEATFEHRFELAAGRALRGRVREAMTRFAPDLVYVHKMADLEVLEELLAAGLPLIRMVHDHDIYCMRSYRYSYFSRKICTRPVSLYCIAPCGAFLTRDREGSLPLKYVSYRAKKREVSLNQRFDRMFVVTQYMKDELILNGFDPARIEIVPPIPRMGDASLRSNFSARNRIVYTGQIIRGKGVDVLLRALALVKEHFECVILGDGGQRAECELLARKLGLEDRVEFKGFVPQDQLKEFYRECSVVAISSVWPEPIATVGLEVMRYGLPVVAFDAGGIKDWLTDGYNGFLVPWMDTAAFARRLEELLRNKELARTMGERGLARASERYNFEDYIGRLESLFQGAVSRHSGTALPRLVKT
jgi:glycosyltransferase involved in cell wall biosynthesis